MQTFLPDPIYASSAFYLDRQRLGKQRLEALSILRINLAFTDPHGKYYCVTCHKLLMDEQKLAQHIAEIKNNPYHYGKRIQVAPFNPERHSVPWANHPAVLMWRGYERQLAIYGRTICIEWAHRGYEDNLRPYFDEIIISSREDYKPPWLGDQRLHDSHKSNLLRKDPQWYAQFDWKVPPTLPYYWPVTKEHAYAG